MDPEHIIVFTNCFFMYVIYFNLNIYNLGSGIMSYKVFNYLLMCWNDR